MKILARKILRENEWPLSSPVVALLLVKQLICDAVKRHDLCDSVLPCDGRE